MTLSKTQREAVALAVTGGNGKLHRWPGGYWCSDTIESGNVGRIYSGAPVEYVGTSTINSLIKHGVVVVTEWKYGKKGRFPITVALTVKEGVL